MDDKNQRLATMLESSYGLSSPTVDLHEIFSYAHFKTYIVGDNDNTLYKLVEYDQGKFSEDDDLVRSMKNGEEIFWIKEYDLVEPLKNEPRYTLYKITLEEDQES
jgi:hypothetical protein